MAYNIRTAHYLKENNIADNMEYNKQIYLKNKHWDPPPAPSNIENKIMEFEKALTTAHLTQVTKTSKLTLNNQTIPQQQTLKLLKSNNNSTIKPTDKNLGPAGMGIYTYISMVLKEHLLTKDYSQILPLEAKRRMENLKQNLISLLQTHQAILTKQEKLYFNRSLETQHRLPVFYGLPKVHKNPVSLRPIISTCGSLLSIFSIWLDFKMKELLQLVKSYLKNSATVINDLKNLIIPQEALLFSTDVKSMYTNIDTNTGLNAIEKFISSNQTQSKPASNQLPNRTFLRNPETGYE